MLAVSLFVAAISLTYVLSTNRNSGLGRCLAPDSMAIMMLIAIFTIRPIFSDRFATAAWYGIYVPSQSEERLAIFVGILAITGLTCGVFAAKLRPARSIKLDSVEGVSEPRWVFGKTALLVTTALATGLYVILLVAVAGLGVLQRLSGGRSGLVDLGGLPEIVLILPLAGAVASAIFLIAARDHPLSSSGALAVIIAASVSVALVAQLGNRRFIIPALLLPVLASVIRKPVRIRVWHILGGAATFIFLAIVPMVRAAGARRQGENMITASLRYLEEEGLGGVLKPVFTSFDTEMFDYIAIASRGLGGEQYGLGRGTLLELLVRPIPSGFGQIGGMPFSEQMLTRLFGGGCGRPFCPVASLPGVLYFDGGFVAVFLGSFVVGFGLRKLSNLWTRQQGLTQMQMLVVITVSSFVLVGVRTNTIHAIWWCVYAILIGYLIQKFVAVQRVPRYSLLRVKR